ncbi:hypothetical protein [Permianibacter aggregans]|nr:hypothetical protein [Permianibacter aggregans]QGX39829.1 hypothetical protein E2H98_09230 [Permianibacter aggregans]
MGEQTSSLLKLGQDYALSFFKIDGTSVGCEGFPMRCPSEIRVTPGYHCVTLHFQNRKGQYADLDLCANILAGKTYLVKFDKAGYKLINVWIEDSDKNVLVENAALNDD